MVRSKLVDLVPACSTSVPACSTSVPDLAYQHLRPQYFDMRSKLVGSAKSTTKPARSRCNVRLKHT
eukprot:1829738-Rhodomonas_salina.3